MARSAWAGEAGGGGAAAQDYFVGAGEGLGLAVGADAFVGGEVA